MQQDKFGKAAEEWARRRDELGPNATRDAVLGWVGALVVGALVYLIFAGGPTPEQRAAADARYEAQQQVREENARLACASGVQRACDELR